MSALTIPSGFSYPVLSKGDKGADVKLCQQFLALAGQPVSVDGDFGKGTVAAVKAFQTAQRLGSDGVVGRKTWDALIASSQATQTVSQAPAPSVQVETAPAVEAFSYPVLCVGSQGADVRTCQTCLNDHGYAVAVDGDFGKGTAAVVKRFQADRGMGADGVVGRQTWDALRAAPAAAEPPGPLPDVLRRMRALGHQIVWKGDYHLNLFGIRNPNRKANRFDDILGCAYTVNGQWRVHYWPGTTDPGSTYLAKPLNSVGTAVLVAGQYLDTWRLDKHQGRYEALCQRGVVRVYRDGNRDAVLDLRAETIEGGSGFGINIHRASETGTTAEVGPWSAGCQVHATVAGFDDMMALARQQVAVRGISTFSYTLLDQWWSD